jgi:hypothetical protein
MILDFETAGNGTALERGAYVGDEWIEAYGFTLTVFAAVGGFIPGNKARVFDTSTPSGDTDLGSPHRYVQISYVAPTFPLISPICFSGFVREEVLALVPEDVQVILVKTAFHRETCL